MDASESEDAFWTSFKLQKRPTAFETSWLYSLYWKISRWKKKWSKLSAKQQELKECFAWWKCISPCSGEAMGCSSLYFNVSADSALEGWGQRRNGVCKTCCSNHVAGAHWSWCSSLGTDKLKKFRPYQLGKHSSITTASMRMAGVIMGLCKSMMCVIPGYPGMRCRSDRSHRNGWRFIYIYMHL
jgi:hypothetical protein